MPFQPSGRPSSSASDWGNILGKGVAGLGEGAARGLQQGLDLLAQNKIQKMQEMQQINKQNQLAELFQKNNYAPEVSEFMSHLYYNNPKAFQQYFPAFNQQEPEPQQDNNMQFDPNAANPEQSLEGLKNYMRLLGGKEPSQSGLAGLVIPQPIGQSEPNMPAKNQLMANQPEQSINQPRKGLLKQDVGNGLTPLQKHEVVKQARQEGMVFSKMYNYAEEMKQLLDSGKVRLGRKSELAFRVSPHNVNEETARFIKLATKLAMEQAAAMKGQVGKHKLERIEAAKPSVLDTYNSNIRDLDDILEVSSENIQFINDEVPEAKLKVPNYKPKSSQEDFDAVRDLSQFNNSSKDVYEGMIRGTEDKPELWDPVLEKYRPAKKKG